MAYELKKDLQTSQIMVQRDQQTKLNTLLFITLQMMVIQMKAMAIILPITL